MRIRTIKPEFFTHGALFDAEVEFKMPLRLAFAGLWCAADKAGRFKWDARRLGVQIMPYDTIEFSRVLDALATRGFIRQYRVHDEVFGVIPSFCRHQVINNRERESDLPEPLGFNDIDACPTRAPRVPHAGQEEGNGRERNRKGTREELRSYAVEISLPDSDGDFMFDHFEETGWKRGTQQVKDWKATLRKWKSGGWLPSQKQNKDGRQTQLEGRGW